MDKSADRQTDNNNSDGNSDRHRIDRKMETHTDRWADGQTGRQTLPVRIRTYGTGAGTESRNQSTYAKVESFSQFSAAANRTITHNLKAFRSSREDL